MLQVDIMTIKVLKVLLGAQFVCIQSERFLKSCTKHAAHDAVTTFRSKQTW